MSRGSAPGERRGGRAKGTPNKPKIDPNIKLEEAKRRTTALLAQGDLTKEQIAVMSPLDVMLHAMRLAASKGHWPAAANIADRAAPYIHPRLASEVHRHLTDDGQRSTEDLERELDALSARAQTANQARTVAPAVPDGPPELVH